MKLSDITSYNDYRIFLKDFYHTNKKGKKKYSYRQFATDLGFKPTNYIHLVLTGKRNLSLDAINKIKSKLPWTAQQKKFFNFLVLFNQSKTSEESRKYEIELERIVGKKRVVLNPDKYAYFGTWYIPVLKEIMTLKNFVSNLNWISKKLKPKISEEEVKKALGILERLGMVQRMRGKWVQADEHLTTPIEVTSEMVFNYHKEMLRLSLNALDQPADKRDISAMTMSLSKKQFQWLKQRVIDFRDEIQQELQGMKEDATLVGQLNMQLFQTTEE